MILIRKVYNGFIVKIKHHGESKPVEYIFENSLEGLRAILNTIIDETGFIGSRHDDERIYVIKAPGDKNNKFTEEHSKVIWGK